MGDRLAILAIKVVEVLFFIGLSGCAVVVLMSWVSVTKGCFTDKN